MSSFCRSMYLFLVFATLAAANPSTPTSSAPSEDQPNLRYQTWHVQAVNGLSRNKVLLIHCKSADDDLGEHNLTAGGVFDWHFRPNIFGRTLFWCYMASHSDHVHAQFNVFWDDGYLYFRCNWKTCTWIAKDDGIFLKNVPRGWDEFQHDWEKDTAPLANSTIL